MRACTAPSASLLADGATACSGRALAFGAEPQTDERHAAEVKRFRAEPPCGMFGDTRPQNVRPAFGSARLAPDRPVKDSDRIDVDGLPKVGVVVWPGQNYCNTARCRPLRAPVPSLQGLLGHVKVDGI